MPKQVPLVIYKRGVRTEIGKIQVNDDGSMDGQVAKDMWPTVKEIFLPRGEFSLGPANPQLDRYLAEANSTLKAKE